MYENNETDQHEAVQPPRPTIIDLVNKYVEQLWAVTEPDGSKINKWCQDVVIAANILIFLFVSN